MRKKDYATLAQILRKKVQFYKSMVNGALTQNRKIYADTMLLCTQDIAQQCSEALNVDRVAFMNACGIDTQQ